MVEEKHRRRAIALFSATPLAAQSARSRRKGMIEGSGEERARMTMTTAIVRMYAYEGDILKFRDSTKAPSLPPSSAFSYSPRSYPFTSVPGTIWDKNVLRTLLASLHWLGRSTAGKSYRLTAGGHQFSKFKPLQRRTFLCRKRSQSVMSLNYSIFVSLPSDLRNLTV